MSDSDYSHPLEVVVGWIPSVVKGRYLGLSSWTMFLWDHGEHKSYVQLNQYCIDVSFLLGPAILFDQEVSLINPDTHSIQYSCKIRWNMSG